MSAFPDTIDVLHVDDDAEFADIAATFLEREDDRFAVRTAKSAAEGLEVLHEFEVDCIVSDYDMPGQSGLDFLESVREEYPDLPFVLYTGKGSEEVASDAISAGVTDYLEKGSGTEQYTVLANRIANAVGHHRSRQALDKQNREFRSYERMVNSMHEAACIYDTEGRFEIVNEYLAEWYGTTREALEGTSSNLIPQIREQADDDPFQALLDGDREELFGEIESEFPGQGHAVLEYRLTPLEVDGSIDGVVGVVRDITERKKREQELQRTTSVLSTLFETLPVGVLAEDQSQNVLAVNRQMLDLFELPGPPEEMVGKDCEHMAESVEEMFVDSAEFLRGRNQRFEDRKPVEDEELSLADGRTFARSYKPIELPEGKGHLWVYQDITERKNTEEQLRKTNSRLEALFEKSPDMINIHDVEGNIIDPNPALAEKTGYDEKELTDMNVWDIDQTVEPDHAKALWERMSHGESQRMEGAYQRKDGSTFPVEIHIRRLDLDGKNRFIVISRDVTGRKEREQKVRAIQRRTQRLMETKTTTKTAEIGVEIANEVLKEPLSSIHLLDDSGNVLEPAAFIDRARDTLEEPPKYYREATDDPASKIVWDVFEAGSVRYLDDIRNVGDLAAVTPARSAIVHPLDDHGVFIVSATEPNDFDSTEKALIEIIASSLTASLDRVQREELLHERGQRLKEKNERLEEFTSIVSHDLRNPLTVAQGRLELARETCQNEHLDSIAQSLDRMDALVANLRTLAREGETAIEIEPLDLEHMVESSWENTETKEATLVTDIDRKIQADESQLRQLLENVINNAVEHGGEAVTITVEETVDGFYIEDDGVGLGDVDRERVFESGYSTATDGTGYGLNIVKQVSEAHGWEIRLTGGSDGGARFEITGVDFAED